MGRYFVAVVPEGAKNNGELRRLFSKMKRTVNEREKESRWMAPELWHVTLQFLGEVGDARLVELKTCLSDWRPRFGAFELKLHGLGAFPDPAAARVLWIGAARTQGLFDLQADLGERLHQGGFAFDEREFKPHLSLVRFRNPNSVEDLIGLGARKSFGEYPIREWILFESFQQGHMPRYVERLRGKLA